MENVEAIFLNSLFLLNYCNSVSEMDLNMHSGPQLKLNDIFTQVMAGSKTVLAVGPGMLFSLLLKYLFLLAFLSTLWKHPRIALLLNY